MWAASEGDGVWILVLIHSRRDLGSLWTQRDCAGRQSPVLHQGICSKAMILHGAYSAHSGAYGS